MVVEEEATATRQARPAVNKLADFERAVKETQQTLKAIQDRRRPKAQDLYEVTAKHGEASLQAELNLAKWQHGVLVKKAHEPCLDTHKNQTASSSTRKNLGKRGKEKEKEVTQRGGGAETSDGCVIPRRTDDFARFLAKHPVLGGAALAQKAKGEREIKAKAKAKEHKRGLLLAEPYR